MCECGECGKANMAFVNVGFENAFVKVYKHDKMYVVFVNVVFVNVCESGV